MLLFLYEFYVEKIYKKEAGKASLYRTPPHNFYNCFLGAFSDILRNNGFCSELSSDSQTGC